MTSCIDNDFDIRVFDIVRAIPCGKVTTYGQIAVMLGYPGNARRVGRALSRAPEGVPCHRVVNAGGGFAPGFVEQKKLLMREGVVLKENGKVNFRLCAWK